MRVTVSLMARPKTKSDPIYFRLPLDVYAALTTRAEEKGRTPSQEAEAIVEQTIRVRVMKEENREGTV